MITKVQIPLILLSLTSLVTGGIHIFAVIDRTPHHMCADAEYLPPVLLVGQRQRKTAVNNVKDNIVL